MAQSFPLLRMLRPTIYIRRRALRRGVFGASWFWKIVAAGIFGRGVWRSLFGKRPDRLGRRTIGPGHIITIATAVPMSRKERKRSGITRARLAAAARAELEAAQAS